MGGWSAKWGNMTNDGRFYPLHDRDQPQFFAPSLRQAVGDQEDVLALDSAVERLGLSQLEDRYSRVGHPAYPPKAMVKVLIYAYSMGLRSSRLIERACKKDDDFRFLAHGLTPDHVSLCRFRHDHFQELKQLFAQTVRLCQQAGLVTLGHVAVDGTKVRANRSARTLAQLKEVLTQALEQAEQEERDLLEPEEPAPGDAEECQFMKTTDGIRPAYNAQVAVDSAHQVILAQEVVTQAADQGELPAMVKQVEEHCGSPPRAVSADGGYYAQASVEQAELRGTKPYLPLPKTGASAFGWVEEESAYRCPQGRWLRAYQERDGRQIYRTSRCSGCSEKRLCGVRGHVKEIHVPLGDPALGRLAERMRTAQGEAIYAARKQIVEPVLGWLKHNRGFRRFLLRGCRGAGAEWSLMCIAHNLAKWAKAAYPGSGMALGQRSRFAQNLAHLAHPFFDWLARRLPSLEGFSVRRLFAHSLTPPLRPQMIIWPLSPVPKK
jgi:transposase